MNDPPPEPPTDGPSLYRSVLLACIEVVSAFGLAYAAATVLSLLLDWPGQEFLTRRVSSIVAATLLALPWLALGGVVSGVALWAGRKSSTIWGRQLGRIAAGVSVAYILALLWLPTGSSSAADYMFVLAVTGLYVAGTTRIRIFEIGPLI